ncbi:MAG TPA: DUF302 domain-containing protein [Gammaproteobacteria bacterium]|nr:DUF302 domain-containing protein [Gammaproteobacteria bacterium]
MKKTLQTGLILLLGYSTYLLAEDEITELPENCNPPLLNMIQCPIADDVSMDDASDSMKLRANALNFKLVAHMPLSEQVKAMGGESKRMEIFQFCDAMIAAKMVKNSLIFAGFLPCRIAMVEDQKGKAWLITMDMDSMVKSAGLPEELIGAATTVRNNIYNILAAGATGDL